MSNNRQAPEFAPATMHDIIRDINNPRREAAIHYLKDGILFNNIICMHIRMAMESKHGVPDFEPNSLINNDDAMQVADICDVSYAVENNVGNVFNSRNTAAFTGE